MNNNQEISLEFNNYCDYCTFNLKGEFILHDSRHKIVWIYSTQTKNNKWKCKRLYEIPGDAKLISISKYDKLFVYSNNSIYEWNILTEKCTRLFYNEDYEVIKY